MTSRGVRMRVERAWNWGRDGRNGRGEKVGQDASREREEVRRRERRGTNEEEEEVSEG